MYIYIYIIKPTQSQAATDSLTTCSWCALSVAPTSRTTDTSARN